jgi:hypothetical protein
LTVENGFESLKFDWVVPEMPVSDGCWRLWWADFWFFGQFCMLKNGIYSNKTSVSSSHFLLLFI